MEGPKVCVLDYGSGNVRSVLNLLASLTPDVELSNDEAVIRRATHLILPGVGSFGAAMEKIKKKLPMEALETAVRRDKKPFLGICVGMQVLADEGREFGVHRGLGWIPGVVEKMDAGKLPVPHIGWNDIHIRQAAPLVDHFGGSQDFYFVHSFVFKPAEARHVLATADYGSPFCCAVRSENIYGVQFHPEKSQKAGRRLINNFLETA